MRFLRKWEGKGSIHRWSNGQTFHETQRKRRVRVGRVGGGLDGSLVLYLEAEGYTM